MRFLQALLPCLLAVTAPTTAAVPVDTRPSTAALERREFNWRQRANQAGRWISDKTGFSKWGPEVRKTIRTKVKSQLGKAVSSKADQAIVDDLMKFSEATGFERLIETNFPEEVQKIYEECMKRQGLTDETPYDDEMDMVLKCKEEMEPIWGPYMEYFRRVVDDEFLIGKDPPEDEKGGAKNQFSELSQEIDKIPGELQSRFLPGTKPGSSRSVPGTLQTRPGLRKGF